MLLADLATLCPRFKPEILKTGIVTSRVEVLIKFNKDGHLSQNINYIKQEFGLHSLRS